MVTFVVIDVLTAPEPGTMTWWMLPALAFSGIAVVSGMIVYARRCDERDAFRCEMAEWQRYREARRIARAIVEEQRTQTDPAPHGAD